VQQEIAMMCASDCTVPPLYVMTSSNACHIWMSAGHSRCNIHHSSGASAA
jgi:hypothetical protein